MKIIIVGCGKVGVSLAERLSSEGHDLVMVDMNPQKVEHLSNQFDALGIVGNGASFNIQQEAGVILHARQKLLFRRRHAFGRRFATYCSK